MALFEVIKKTKADKNLVWRYPKTNFNTGSHLVVDESQEALFYSEGKALDLFGPGKYTLSTNNIPIIKNVLNIGTGFKTPFTCQVYFIDMTEKQSKWGTSSKIEFLEPKYNFPIKIGACGEFRFKVVDSKKLIVKLVGIKKDFTETNVDDFFSSQIMVKVKDYIANIVKEDKISIFEIDGYLDRMSMEIKEKLVNDFMEYGIELNKFLITTIAKPEDEREYLEFKELYFKQGVALASAEATKNIELTKAHMEASKKVIDSEAMAIKRSQEGYSYQDEKGFEVSKEVARNNAVGQFTNIGIGLGMLSGVSQPLGNQVSKQVSGAFIKGSFCSNCGTENDLGASFCKKCGSSLNTSKVCPNCNNTLSSDAMFCSHCGKKVD